MFARRYQFMHTDLCLLENLEVGCSILMCRCFQNLLAHKAKNPEGHNILYQITKQESPYVIQEKLGTFNHSYEIMVFNEPRVRAIFIPDYIA